MSVVGDEKKHDRWWLRFAGVTSLFLILSVHPIQAEENRPMKEVKMGYSSKLFSDVDIRDAQVAMELLTAEMNRTIAGGKFFPKCTIYQDTISMTEAINRQEIDMITLPTVDYLRMKNKLQLEPFFTSANHVDDGQQRLLIVRKDRGITKIAQLKDKIVNTPSSLKDEISSMWLDILLAREGIREKGNFLRQVKEVNKASQAVLPVFFKQTDSAIVTRSAFELISVLNPQLKEDLSILTSSKSFLGGVFFIHKNLDESIKRLLVEKITKLNESPTGKQIYTLLQVDRIIPFQPSYLDNLIELEREYRQFSETLAKRR